MPPFSRSPVVAFFSVLVLLLATPGILSLYTDMSSSDHAGPSANVKAANNSWRGHVPLDVEGYPVAPADLELEQVHVYIRHGMFNLFWKNGVQTSHPVPHSTGERTPVGVRMADPPASLPKHWSFCHTARHFRAAVTSRSQTIPGTTGNAGADDTSEESLRTLRVVERADGTIAPGEW